VHGTGVGRGAALGLVEVHLGDEGERLIRLGGDIAIDALALPAAPTTTTSLCRDTAAAVSMVMS
jgi:hypothetical protein